MTTPPVGLPASPILRTTSRLLVPLMLLFSLFVVLRGHHEPGGGFGGALVAVAAFGLYAIGRGERDAHLALRWRAEAMALAGAAVMVGSGALGLVSGRGLLRALWVDLQVPGLAGAQLGTPLLFDLGVYLAVLGSTLTIVFALERRARVMPE